MLAGGAFTHLHLPTTLMSSSCWRGMLCVKPLHGTSACIDSTSSLPHSQLQDVDLVEDAAPTPMPARERDVVDRAELDRTRGLVTALQAQVGTPSRFVSLDLSLCYASSILRANHCPLHRQPHQPTFKCVAAFAFRITATNTHMV